MHLACDVSCACGDTSIEMHDAIVVSHARTKRTAQASEFSDWWAA
jgi:hypothetical protein